MVQERFRFDPGHECRLVAARFRDAAGPPGRATEALCASTDAAGPVPTSVGPPDPGIVPWNVVFFLPYALVDAFGFAGRLEAARTMARGNVLGAAHFLQGDRHLDGHERPTPSGLRLADATFAGFVREFASLFPPGTGFWSHFDRYLDEYYSSLQWERDVLWAGSGAAALTDDLSTTLRMLGRKLAPLKATAAGVTLLAGRTDALAPLERAVDDYHAAYQLADDLEDLEEDLEAGRWSAGAWFLCGGSALTSPREAGSAGELLSVASGSGALEALVQLIRSRFERAASAAARVGAAMLASYLSDCGEHAGLVLGRMARRLAIAGRVGGDGAAGAERGSETGGCGESGRASGDSAAAVRSGQSPPQKGPEPGRPHCFTVGGDAMVYDPLSGLFFEADAVAADVASWMSAGGSEDSLAVLRMDHGSEAVAEALRELDLLRGGDARRLHALAAFGGARSAPAAVDDGHRPRALVAGGDACDPSAPSVSLSGGPRARPSLSSLAAVALNVSGGCNLACDYCYLGRSVSSGRRPMSDATAFKGIDLLFDESFGGADLAVVFFGGEPLLNVGLIERAARRARERAESEGRRVSFHVTTNGTLLTPEVASVLSSLDVSVLVSMDGPRAAHDRHRTFANGSGSYETVAANVRALPEGRRPGARVTVTEDSPPLVEIVSHLRDLGFRVVHTSPVSGAPMSRSFADRLVGELDELARAELESMLRGGPPVAGCFVEPVLSLELGRFRSAPCGAGARYVSVDWDGRLFLCHRFAGDARFAVGDVESGLDRRAVGELIAVARRLHDGCEGCWARGLCGGPCHHDAFSAGPTGYPDERCRVTRRVLELSMWLYASLPAERRERLAEVARRVSRPELCMRDRASGGR